MESISQKSIVIIIFISILTVSGIFAACNFPRPDRAIEVSVFASAGIDARFLPLYQTLGGETVLGEPISPILEEGEQWCQYTMNAKMCVIAGRSDLEAYSLAPVVVEGALMPEVSHQPASQESGKVVNGYVIHPDFIDLFDRLYGTLFAGQPLDNAWINYDRGRIEQYFENVVIAQDLDDPTQTAYLLPVAHAVCTYGCELSIDQAVFIPETQSASTQSTSPFSTFLSDVNGFVFGEPLTKPFINTEGMQVQVFEYVAIAAEPNDLSRAWLLPLSYELDMFETEPSDQRYGIEQDVYFYPVGQKGYHVVTWFDAFIREHGGRTIAGNPIAEIAYYEDDIRQCFENYCLDLVQDSETGLPAAELAPLGAWYVDKLVDQRILSQDILLVDWVTADDVQFEIYEQYPMIDHETAQVITLSIISTMTGEPLSGIPSHVTLITPDNQTIELALMNTDGRGISSVSVPAHRDLENGTVIRYEVCVELVSGEEACATNAYLVKD
jgi:hypothetical protein